MNRKSTDIHRNSQKTQVSSGVRPRRGRRDPPVEGFDGYPEYWEPPVEGFPRVSDRPGLRGGPPKGDREVRPRTFTNRLEPRVSQNNQTPNVTFAGGISLSPLPPLPQAHESPTFFS